jgi:hypothetical protein
VCVSDDRYYVITQEGDVLLWSLEEDDAVEEWSSIWHWAKDVWLES